MLTLTDLWLVRYKRNRVLICALRRRCMVNLHRSRKRNVQVVIESSVLHVLRITERHNDKNLVLCNRATHMQTEFCPPYPFSGKSLERSKASH
uniref:Uncharacterized protein n=1 Tax=Hyaloperonospora arabidopsidis (strain Emoy2) TaxID=559515 RepID=M4BMP7_HYAAE